MAGRDAGNPSIEKREREKKKERRQKKHGRGGKKRKRNGREHKKKKKKRETPETNANKAGGGAATREGAAALIDSDANRFVRGRGLSLSSFRPNKVLSPTDDSVGNNEVARCVTTESRSLFSPEEKEIKTQ